MLDAARGRAVGLGYTAGWRLVKTLPKGVSERAFRAAADAATVRNGPATRQLRRNLRRVVGPAMSELRLDTLVGDALRSYSRYWLETFRLEAMDHRAVAASFNVNSTGVQHLDEALDRGRGVVLALPHSGNWDASGIWLVDRHGPFTTVAERLEPAAVFDRFVAYRESLGMEVIALTGGERPPTDVLAERLRANKVVCLLADRDLSRQGVPVRFFGEATRMPAGPALLAARTGAALMTVHSHFAGADGWGHDISAPVQLSGATTAEQVAGATQQVADHFARGIRSHPADWHMLQKLWLADLPPRPDPAD